MTEIAEMEDMTGAADTVETKGPVEITEKTKKLSVTIPLDVYNEYIKYSQLVNVSAVTANALRAATAKCKAFDQWYKEHGADTDHGSPY